MMYLDRQRMLHEKFETYLLILACPCIVFLFSQSLVLLYRASNRNGMFGKDEIVELISKYMTYDFTGGTVLDPILTTFAFVVVCFILYHVIADKKPVHPNELNDFLKRNQIYPDAVVYLRVVVGNGAVLRDGHMEKARGIVRRTIESNRDERRVKCRIEKEKKQDKETMELMNGVASSDNRDCSE